MLRRLARLVLLAAPTLAGAPALETPSTLLISGNRADVVIFHPAGVSDRGTPANPSESPVGIETVLVNGVLVLDGRPTGARPGRGLRRGRGRP